MRVALVFLVLSAGPARATVPIPSLLMLADVERLTPTDRVRYFEGIQATINYLGLMQMLRFREGWSEAGSQSPAVCFAEGTITRTVPFKRPPDCRQYEKSIDGMLRSRFCWKAKRYCPALATIKIGSHDFRCRTPVRHPCNPLIFGFRSMGREYDEAKGRWTASVARPHRGPYCTKFSPVDSGECRGHTQVEFIPKVVRELGLAKAFDDFARDGFAPLCQGHEAERVLTDKACETLAQRLRQHALAYRAKLDAGAARAHTK